MFRESTSSRRGFLRAATMTIAATPFGSLASANTRSDLSPLDRATAWLNSPPLTAAELHGRVVLVEFWTYSCINWRRQLPYVRAWAEKYKDQSLVVIGVHSPELSFEKDIENIRWAIKDMRIAYPIAVDSDHAIWNGFNNAYWPAVEKEDAREIATMIYGEVRLGGHFRFVNFGHPPPLVFSAEYLRFITSMKAGWCSFLRSVCTFPQTTRIAGNTTR